MMLMIVTMVVMMLAMMWFFICVMTLRMMARMMGVSKLVMMTMIMIIEVKFLRELPPSTTLSTATATSRPHNPCYRVLGKKTHEKS